MHRSIHPERAPRARLNRAAWWSVALVTLGVTSCGGIDGPRGCTTCGRSARPAVAWLIVPEQAAGMLAGGESLTVLDCRSGSAYERGHLAGAVHVDVHAGERMLTSRLDAFDRDTAYLVYCRTGERALRLGNRMAAMGFERVYAVIDGGGTSS